MTKRAYGFMGTLLWVIFVDLIAPDIGYVRSLLAAVVGWMAIWLISTNFPNFSITARCDEGEKIQGE